MVGVGHHQTLDSTRPEGAGMMEWAVALVVEWNSEWVEVLQAVG